MHSFVVFVVLVVFNSGAVSTVGPMQLTYSLYDRTPTLRRSNAKRQTFQSRLTRRRIRAYR